MKSTYKGLQVDVPYDLVEIEDIKIIQNVNDHSYARIKLLIPEDKIIDSINKNVEDEKVIIEENGKVKFVGKISKVDIKHEGRLTIIELEAVSYTKDFDIKKKSRTFCDLNMTYKEVIDRVLKDYPKKEYRDNITQGSKIFDFMLQFEETDWEFLKRIATHFGGSLIADCTVEYGRFYFGL